MTLKPISRLMESSHQPLHEYKWRKGIQSSDGMESSHQPLHEYAWRKSHSVFRWNPVTNHFMNINDVKAIQSWNIVTNHFWPLFINVSNECTELAQDRLKFQQRWFLTTTIFTDFQKPNVTTYQVALPFWCSTLWQTSELVFKSLCILHRPIYTKFRIIIMLFSRLSYVALVREIVCLGLLYGKFLMVYLNRCNRSQSPPKL